MKNNNRFKAVIFDLDGLILDTEVISYNAWKKALAEFGYVLDDDTYHKIIGLIVPDIENVFRRRYDDGFPLEKINQRRLQYVYEYISCYGIKIKPGFSQLLDLIDASKLSKAVATSSNTESAKRKLTASSLINRFDYLICGDQVRRGKPAPDIFLLAAKKLRVEPADCLVFEDSENGVRAAHSAKMTTIMVPDVKQPSEDVAALAYKIFHSLTDVIPFIKKILTAQQ